MAQRENAMVRMAAIAPLALLPSFPSSTWLGSEKNGVVPITTFIRHICSHSLLNNIHVLEIFGGIGLGALRAA